MPITHFTDTKIDSLKLPKNKGQVDYFETQKGGGRSLILTLSRSGRKTWSVLFYDRGKPKRKKLGYYPDLKCKQAWEEVRVFDAKTALARIEAGSFKAVGEDWFRDRVEGSYHGARNQTPPRQIQYPEWEKRAFTEIERADINGLLRKIEKGQLPKDKGKEHTRRTEGGKCQADAMLGTIRNIMNWYAVEAKNYVSPIVRGMKRDRREVDDKARDRILMRTRYARCGPLAARRTLTVNPCWVHSRRSSSCAF